MMHEVALPDGVQRSVVGDYDDVIISEDRTSYSYIIDASFLSGSFSNTDEPAILKWLSLVETMFTATTAHNAFMNPTDVDDHYIHGFINTNRMDILNTRSPPGQRLIITCRVFSISNSSFMFENTVKSYHGNYGNNNNNNFIMKGIIGYVLLDIETNKRIAVPDHIRQAYRHLLVDARPKYSVDVELTQQHLLKTVSFTSNQIDFNNHINNKEYIMIALKSGAQLLTTYRSSHVIGFEVFYVSEGRPSDKMKVYATHSNGCLHFRFANEYKDKIVAHLKLKLKVNSKL